MHIVYDRRFAHTGDAHPPKPTPHDTHTTQTTHKQARDVEGTWCVITGLLVLHCLACFSQSRRSVVVTPCITAVTLNCCC
jgi:hypothetical protein